jgi:DNA-binding beta-propeller fold protein YncE
MQRSFRGWLLGPALAGCLALGLSPAGAQSAFEVDRFPFGLSVGTVAVSERTGRVYVAPDPFAGGGAAGRAVVVFDRETHAPLAPLFFGADAIIGDVVVHPTNGRVYVSLLNQDVVAVVDEITGQTVKRIPVQSQPLAMAVDAPADRLYVAHHDSPALSTINTLTETADVPMIGPELVATLPRSTSAGLAVDAQNGRIYHRVTLTESGRSALFWLFREPGRIRATSIFTSGTGQVVFNPFTGTGYLALEEERQLQPVTGRDALLVHSTTAVKFKGPHGLALDPITARLYVTGFGSSQVGIFDVSAARATAPALLEQVTVGEKPRAIAVDSRTHRAYVLNTGDQSFSIIRDRNFSLPTPTVSAAPDVASNQWSNQDVTLTLTFGPGLVVGPRELVFQVLGAKEIPRSTTGSTPLAIPFSQEGSSTLFYAARAVDTLSSDPNPPIALSPPGLFQVNIDKTSPVVTLAALDKERWFGSEVAVAGTATDNLSGLADPANDGTFSLRATGQEGEETANAATDSRTIRDAAGNSVTAGPITGIKIDRKAPTLTIQSPAAGASFLLNEKVLARFSATDGGSGLKSVSASVATGAAVANGGRLPTGQVGRQALLPTAADNVGNLSIVNLPYTVLYGVKRLDKGKFKAPGNVAVKLQLQDAARKNQSSSAIPVTALRIEPAKGGAATPINLPFIFNKKLGGKGGGYQLVLSINSLPKGEYRMMFTAGADGVEHEARFTLR